MRNAGKPPTAAACDDSEHRAGAHVEPPVSEEAYERAARFFRAEGDVSRLKLLTRLAEGEWCVTELHSVHAVDAGAPQLAGPLLHRPAVSGAGGRIVSDIG
jgi:hypothetical protein